MFRATLPHSPHSATLTTLATLLLYLCCVHVCVVVCVQLHSCRTRKRTRPELSLARECRPAGRPRSRSAVASPRSRRNAAGHGAKRRSCSNTDRRQPRLTLVRPRTGWAAPYGARTLCVRVAHTDRAASAATAQPQHSHNTAGASDRVQG